MGLFGRKPAPPWYEEALSRAHADVLELLKRIAVVEQTVGMLSDGVSTAKAMERRMAASELAVKQLGGFLQDEIARLTAALEVVRGYATGARGGRPRNEEREAERQALQLGQRVIQLMGTPEGRAQLILELQQVGGAAGAVDATGTPKWQPPNGGGSPV